MATYDQSIKSLLKDLIDETTRLLRYEMRLMQAEGQEKLTQVQTGVISIASGLLVSFCALLILLQALVIGLAKIMPAWLAAVAVGGTIALIGWALIAHGQRNLRAQNLKPERTIQSLRETRDMVEEKAR
jgi:hypothetical protein